MKKVLSFVFFYIAMILAIIAVCFVLFFFFVILLLQKVFKFLVPKKAQEMIEDIIDDTSNFLGVENKPYVEAENFTEYDQQNKHPNPEITS